MRVLCVGVVACLLVAMPAFAGKRAPEGWTVPLDQLGFNGSLDRLPEPKNWQIKQVSSYDRSGGNADDRRRTNQRFPGRRLALTPKLHEDLRGPLSRAARFV